jgi:RND family efflux transporter MFP subunit
MKLVPKTAARLAVTLVLIAAALVAARHLWVHYRETPWTRDGRVRADVVQVAPDVSGLIEGVRVHDNQVVNRGDILFTIDRARYRLAVAQAEAASESLRVQIAQAGREDRRNAALGDLVAAELREQSTSKRDQLKAALSQATASLETARLNLARTEVRAPVDGWVTNLDLRPGTYASAGKPVLAVVDRQSLHVLGYFEETKIARVRIGDAVHVRLVGEVQQLDGHVDSIAAAIEDRERQASPTLLANVNPTFNWVRLAQRIPVRVQLDRVPPDVRLIMGRTATVEVVEGTSSAATVIGSAR